MARIAAFAIAVAALGAWPCRAAAQVGAPGLTGYVTIASDYRARGLSQANGEGALQLGIDFRHDSGWFAGAWGANVEYAVDAARTEARRSEIGYYTGYDWRQGPFRLTATWSLYTYPDAWFDYNYDELAGQVSYRERLFFSVAYTDDFYGVGRSALTPELGFAWPLAWNAELGGSLGRLDYGPAPQGGYTYWNLGVSKVARRLAIDLRFHDASFEQAAYYGTGMVERWVLSVSYGFAARR